MAAGRLGRGGCRLLAALRRITPADALGGVAKGSDVHLFLTGMMPSEVARETGLSHWVAAQAARRARGSPARLFLLVYAVGTLVTVFLSNDATAVVLTPAVAAAAKAARVAEPLPCLFACALIANAASFVLPISNPATLVLYGARVPSLLAWLPRCALPSLAAVGATDAVLRWTRREALRGATAVAMPDLAKGGRTAAWGIAGIALVLLGCSGLDLALGWPTCPAGPRRRRPCWFASGRTPDPCWRAYGGRSCRSWRPCSRSSKRFPGPA